MIAGILPEVATDLVISIPTAGLLVSLYALGVAIGGPLLATFTGRFPRKLLLLVYVGVFTVGYVACALAANFGAAARSPASSISLIHGAYFGTAMVLAATLIDEKRRGFAVALILSGLTVANVLGVPIGTAIGQAFGWRMTFWAVARARRRLAGRHRACSSRATTRHEAGGGNLLAEIKALGREPVYTSLAIIILQTVGQFALFTYIAPVLTDVSGIASGFVPWLLLIFGIGSTVGVLAGGRLSDWKLMPSLIGILAVQVVVYLLMGLFVGSAWAMTVLVLALGHDQLRLRRPGPAPHPQRHPRRPAALGEPHHLGLQHRDRRRRLVRRRADRRRLRLRRAALGRRDRERRRRCWSRCGRRAGPSPQGPRPEDP